MRRKNVKTTNSWLYSIENNDDNLVISALSLGLTAILALPFVVFMISESEKLSGGIFGFLLGLTAYFAGFILSLFTTVTSLVGFLMGHSSIKCFETKRKRTWAIIVTAANFVALIGSVIGVIYFSSIFR